MYRVDDPYSRCGRVVVRTMREAFRVAHHTARICQEEGPSHGWCLILTYHPVDGYYGAHTKSHRVWADGHVGEGA